MNDHLAADVAAYLTYLRGERGRSANTLKSYAYDLERFCAWVRAGGLADPLNPRRRELSAYIVSLSERGLAPASVQRHLAALKGFYKFLRLDGRTDNSAADLVNGPRLPQRLPQGLGAAAIDKLLASPDPARDRHYFRDKAILEAMYSTGCRASELPTVRLDGLDLARGCCRVIGKGDKERLVPLGRPAVQAIRDYVAKARAREDRGRGVPWLFVSQKGDGQLKRVMVFIIVKKHAKRCGLTVHPHQLRHSCATDLIAGGANILAVQKVLGHANINTTQIYTHVSPQGVLDSFNAAHPRA